MNIISLPQTLPGELDLADINLHLHLGEATLDWSQVQEASEAHLAVLLADLDLVEHSDVLGIDTIPDHLSHIVLHTLSDQQNTPHLAHHQHTPPAHDDTFPFVLTPEANIGQPIAAPQDETPPQPLAKQILRDSPRTILQPLSPSAMRDELERLVLLDLLGPAGGPEEELDEGHVRDRYLVGMLAPRDQHIVPEELDELAVPEESSSEDGANDDAALQINSLCPSSIGMSFCVVAAATSLSVTATWGYYRRDHSETLKTPKGAPKLVWKRQQMGGKPEIFPLQEGLIPPWSPEPEEQPDVVVRGLVRRTADSWTVTLFLVNEQREPEHRRDEAWVFQPELRVESPDGAPIFQHRSTGGRTIPSDDEQAMAMLYRRHAGQPKTTAEYIQATSRVGRNAPGLVCVVFNWARPRDLSHYEQFEHYHATFYQQVEALSVTPFAPRAIDRGLAALLVSYVRLLGPEFNENSQAGNVIGTHPYFLAALNELPRRAIAVTGSTEVGEAVLTALQDLRAQWLKTIQANVGTRLGYKTRKDGQTIGLLRQPSQGDWTPFTCLNSLRDVEPSINLIHDERGLGDIIAGTDGNVTDALATAERK